MAMPRPAGCAEVPEAMHNDFPGLEELLVRAVSSPASS